MTTLADVARHAGVASSTVSYVLSGKRSVSQETRERVRRAVETLGYHPNVGARALASSRSNVLALIVPLRSDTYVPVMLEIAIGVVTQARGHGYDVLLLTNDEGSEGIRRVASSARADAVILTDIGLQDDRIATIAETGVDAVLIGVPADPAGLDCVDLDFAAAGRLCVGHLAQLGHRTVAFIGEAEGVYRRHIGFAERTLQGIQDGAAALGIDLVHRPCGGSYEAAAGALARIFEERPHTTGLIVQNEGIIPPLMSLLRTSGRAVPEDVSIVALCPDQVAEQTAPRLTSVTIPATELGTRAVELLMRRMADGAAGEVMLIPPSLTVRGSTGARPLPRAPPQTPSPAPSGTRRTPLVSSISEIGSGMPGFEWSSVQETLRVEPWGPDGIRVRGRVGPILDGLPGALDDEPEPSQAKTEITATSARVVNGRVTAELTCDVQEHGQGMLRFTSTATGAELLAEQPIHWWWPGPRMFAPMGNGYHRLEQSFRSYEGERLYGLGQHGHGLLDQKGTVLDLVQRNGEVTIPFTLSSRGYGLLWNNPAIGRVELAENGTRWVADSARQIDYWVTAGTPAEIIGRYADATGHVPMLPEWASGFWQSRLRYRTQDELLAVAREYARRGLPLSVIVVDYFHWTHLGDWKFDHSEWPDPAALTAELRAMGVKLMVSVWPSVSPVSENFGRMRDDGLLIGTEFGPLAQASWPDKGVAAPVDVAFYDATNPRAREFVWGRVRDNYLRPYGIDVWWLDACEPELRPGFQGNLRYHAGPGLEVGNMYPRENARTFAEGMAEESQPGTVSLVRSAWAGSQRYGAALWSGDIPATFASLRAQIRSGLNVAISGIPWWTSDIGGFHGGDPGDPEYRELIVRWFQYGALCPLFRLHGNREPTMPFGLEQTGGPNEPWSFGPQAYEHIAAALFLRERLRPYIMTLMRAAHEEGIAPMRPMFVDFPADAAAWEVEDAYMFGPDLLVAPAAEYGARDRPVYLPHGSRWTDAWTGGTHDGGNVVRAGAPLGRIPLFLRDGADLPIG